MSNPAPAITPPQPSQQPQPGARLVMRLVIGGAGTAIYLALASWSYGAAMAGDMTGAIFLLIGAWIVAVGALYVSEEYGALQIKNRKTVTLLIVAVITTGTGGIYVWENNARHKPEQTGEKILALLKGQQKPNPQKDELIKLSELVAGDEDTLRKRYGFYDYLAINVFVQTARIRWAMDGNYGPLPHACAGYVSITEGHWNRAAGLIYPGKSIGRNGVDLKEGPNDVFILCSTQQQIDAIAKLKLTLQSPLIQSDVQAAGGPLLAAVQHNADLLFSVLGEKKKQDDRYFLLSGDESTKFGAAISTEYWSKFERLEFAAIHAQRKIQAHLKAN